MDFAFCILLCVIVPCALAAWFGTRFRSPLVALFVTWAISPIVSTVGTVVLVLVLKPLAPDTNSTVKTMTYFLGPLPGAISGLLAGPIAGIFAAMIVSGRRRNELAKSDVSDQSGVETQSKP